MYALHFVVVHAYFLPLPTHILSKQLHILILVASFTSDGSTPSISFMFQKQFKLSIFKPFT